MSSTGLLHSSAAAMLRKTMPDTRTAVFIAVALLCIFMPLEISHLLSALLGAGLYLLLQTMSPRRQRPASVVNKTNVPRSSSWARGPALRTRGRAPPNVQEVRIGTPSRSQAGPGEKPEAWRPSAKPVAAPSFQSVGWEGEMAELVGQIAPTAECDATVGKIAQIVKRAISATIPEAEVIGFAGGNIANGKAFGVAVPEVDIVIKAPPAALLGRMQKRGGRFGKFDAKQLEKSIIRACTDRLVNVAGFKFRRSAFRGREPKVTLLVPASPGLCAEAVPLNFSVNSVTPFHNAALLKDCGQMDPRAKALILAVKRWAKDRGVCHAAKGHLPPYCWTILTIYYLQVGDASEGPFLPTLDGFPLSGPMTTGGVPSSWPGKTGSPESASTKSVGELFKDFVHFYATQFDWSHEAVSLHSGKRAPRDPSLPAHVLVHQDGVTTEVAPTVQDPFESTHNLADCVTATSLLRLREELARAEELCAQGASLNKLLEPWSPAAGAEGSSAGGDGGDLEEEQE